MVNAVSPATVHAGRPSSAYVIALSCVAAIGGFLFGYDTAVISGAVGFIQAHFALRPIETGWAGASAILLGASN